MRGSQKNKYYQTAWNPNIAYATGLLTADGNLSNDGRHIDLTSKDIQLLNSFKKCISLKGVRIGTKISGYSGEKCPRIQFSNVKLYRWLLEVGLTPNKSRTISALKIPNKYFFDFLRGYFDGDGSCYSFWDERWNSSFMFYITFSSGSENYIKWLRQKNKELMEINGSISRCKGRNTIQLKYAKREGKILFNKMYYKTNLPCLERKHKKLIKILEIDKKEIDKIVHPERVLKLVDSLD